MIWQWLKRLFVEQPVMLPIDCPPSPLYGESVHYRGWRIQKCQLSEWTGYSYSGFKHNDQNQHLTGHSWLDIISKIVELEGESTMEILAEIETRKGDLIVTRTDGLYTITVGGVVRHPNVGVDGVIGALAHYIHGAEYSLMKTSDPV